MNPAVMKTILLSHWILLIYSYHTKNGQGLSRKLLRKLENIYLNIIITHNS